MGTHLCRVEPLDCIVDNNFFVKQLERLEHCYSKKLHARWKLRQLLCDARFIGHLISTGSRAACDAARLQNHDVWKWLRATDLQLPNVAYPLSEMGLHDV